MSIASIYEPAQEGLGLVEERLRSYVQADRPWLAEPLSYVLERSGKLMRPVVCLLAGKLYNYDLEKLVPMATAIELFHNATLVHDDAVDRSSVRRGKATVNSLWGEGVSVLLGDYLFSVSAELVCSIGNLRVLTMFARTLTDVSSGQMRETSGAYSWQQSRQDYYEQIGCKTASLFTVAAGSAAVLSGAPDEAVEALSSYGHNMGLAFQVVDDVLDFVGDEGEMGKPVGSDLLQGTMTLPTILLVERRAADDPLKGLVDKPGDRDEVARVIERVRDSSILDDCYSIAADFCDQARRSLEGLPDKDSRKALLTLADYVIERRR